MTDAAPLGGVRVIDLSTGIAGGYATKLLADAGADVVKVEPPGGDPLRAWSASGRSRDAAGDGVLFRYLHTSKRGVVLDIASPPGHARLLELYAATDLVFESFTPGQLDRMGLGRSALAALRPSASLVAITPFGQTGPWRDWPANEFTLQAWTGCLACRGRRGREPVQAGGGIGDWMGGAYAAVAALAALRRADASGRGEHVDLSLLEAMLPTFTNLANVWGSMSGIADVPPADEIPSVHRTRDGWVGFCIFTGQQWSDFTVLIERPELREQVDLATMPGRIARGDELRGVIDGFTARHTTEEIERLGELLRVPVVPVGNGANLPGMPHFALRETFAANPRGGFLQPRVPYRPEGWEPRAFAPAPRLDEHASTALTPLAARPPVPGVTPLAGLRVLDLTAFWAGPYAGLVLAGLGADVIHVESIQRPDGMRFGSVRPPGSELWWEWGPTFHAANLGKRSLALDLANPRGRALLERLIARADVLLENFSPRVMDQFGLDAQAVARIGPHTVYVRMPGFGLGGPWRERVGFAQTMEQLAGIAWLTGYADRGPMNARGPMDPLAGLHAVFAALLGLARRDQTGRGGAIESVMIEVALGVAAEPVLEHSASGELLGRTGNRSLGAAPQGIYATAPGPAGEARWLAISVDDDAQWPALARALGRDAWAGSLASREARAELHDEIDTAIAAWCEKRDPLQAARELLTAGVPAAVVTGSRRGGALEPIRARGFLADVTHPVAGTHAMPTLPWISDPGAPRGWSRPAPLLGQHGEAILREELGLSEAELTELRAERIIGVRPLGT